MLTFIAEEVAYDHGEWTTEPPEDTEDLVLLFSLPAVVLSVEVGKGYS